LGSLAEDDADALRVRLAVQVRLPAKHTDGAGSRDEDAGQDLDRGRLAGAVGAEVGDRFTRCDGERDVVERRPGRVFTGHERADRAERTAEPFRLAELPFQVDEFDDGHDIPPCPGVGSRFGRSEYTGPAMAPLGYRFAR